MNKKEVISVLEKLLPGISAEIQKLTGSEIELIRTCNKSRDGEDRYGFCSEDISDKLTGFTKAIFKEIKVETWGGNIFKNEEGDEILCVLPKLSYNHHGGGSNGTTFIWNVIYLNLTKGEWIKKEENRIF